jgi:hypothetical protein
MGRRKVQSPAGYLSHSNICYRFNRLPPEIAAARLATPAS